MLLTWKTGSIYRRELPTTKQMSDKQILATVTGHSNENESSDEEDGLCSSSVTAALALMTINTKLLLWDKPHLHLMTVITQLLLWDKLLSSLLYLGQVKTSPYKGLTRIQPLSCGFDSSVGRALHRHRRGCGFKSRSEPEFFQVSVVVVLRPHLH